MDVRDEERMPDATPCPLIFSPGGPVVAPSGPVAMDSQGNMYGVASGALAHIPLAALAGVTAWMGICLLDMSAWRRLARMRIVNAGAFVHCGLTGCM